MLVSDVHLQSLADTRGQLLLDVISRLQPGAVEYFILNGDIFDFCFGESRYFQEKFRLLGTALTRLVQGGTRVFFIEGNHEFHMRPLTTFGGWDGVEIIATMNQVITLKDGTRFKISHGDLIKNEPLYRAFRGLVKSRFAKSCAKLLPGHWLDAYALKHARVSRATDGIRTLNHAVLLQAAQRWLADDDTQHGIFGHFHVPYAEPRVVGQGKIMSVDSWDKPNLLLFEAGCFWRVFLSRPGADYSRHQAEALFH